MWPAMGKESLLIRKRQMRNYGRMPWSVLTPVIKISLQAKEKSFFRGICNRFVTLRML